MAPRRHIAVNGARALAALLVCVAGGQVAAQEAAGSARAAPTSACRAGGDAPVSGERSWSWRMEQQPLADAVRRIATAAGWRLSYSEATLPVTRVTVRCRVFDPRRALDLVLRGTGLQAHFRGQLVIIAPEHRPPGAHDSTRAQPLPLTRIEADPLERAPLAMAVPAPLPGAAAYTLRLDTLSAVHGMPLGDVLRAMAPGLAAWDRGVGALRLASVRGRGTDGGPGVRVFVDGVEVADPSALLTLDTRTLAAVQWLPGPASAAAYGGDALDGVLHVHTRAGESVSSRDMRSQYTTALRAGSAAARHRRDDAQLGDAAFTSTWRQRRGSGVRTTVSSAASVQWQETPVQAAPGRLASGAITAALDATRWQVTASARAAGGRQRQAVDPALTLGAAEATTRRTLAAFDEERQRDAQLAVQAALRTGALEHALSLSVSRADREASTDATATRPADTLSGVWQGRVSRRAARYAVQMPLLPRAPNALRLQWLADVTQLQRAAPDTTVSAVRADSTLAQSAAGSSVLLRGAAGPMQWSAGVRAEWNDAFGERLRMAWLPTMGLTLTRARGMQGAWQLRAAYGASLRAPQPSMSLARSTSLFVQRAHPELIGERLRGGEVGLSARGATWSLELTGYRQRTDGFTQLVTIGAVPVDSGLTRREVQYRSVGVLLAQGVELRVHRQGALGAFDVTATAVRSRLQSLDAGYVGPLRVGSAPLEAPRSSLTALWSRPMLRGRVSLGASVLGPWDTNVTACTSDGPSACDLARVQRVAASARWQALYARALGGGWQWRLRAENLTNNQRADGSAVLLAPGRSISLEIGRW